MTQVTTAQIKAIAGPGARNDLVAAIVRGWPAAERKAKLTTLKRAAHFIAQIMTETGGLQILEESGAYRAARIMTIFGVGHHSAAITESEARRIAALPISERGPVLFNRVYGIGNPKKMHEFQNTGPNDGWLYRGGGMMQATGKSNYAAMEKKTGLPLVAHPEMLHNPDSAFMAAYLEWIQDGRCNAAADRDDVIGVRHIINGGLNGIAECRSFLAKAKTALAGYHAAADSASVAPSVPVAPVDTAPLPIEPAVVSAPPVPPPSTLPADPAVTGDPELFSVQKRLKARNYSPGVVDGLWGSGTSGALGGFINDRGGHIPVPASLDAFNAVREDIKAELGRAESETQPDGTVGWLRPVSAARKAGDAATVSTIAPEVVPVQQNRTLTVWGAVCAFFTGIYKTFSDTISGWWDFIFDHKDDIPTDPSVLQTAWGYVTALPSEVWIFAGAIGLVFIAVRLHGAVKKIKEDIKTGARQ